MTSTDRPDPDSDVLRALTDNGGDAACWAHRVCQACGRLNDADRPKVCEACGAAFPDPDD